MQMVALGFVQDDHNHYKKNNLDLEIEMILKSTGVDIKQNTSVVYGCALF